MLYGIIDKEFQHPVHKKYIHDFVLDRTKSLPKKARNLKKHIFN
jgi:hypothetical protein